MSENKKELSVDELVNIAQTPTKIKIEPKTDHTDAHSVILSYNLKEGKIRVRASYIYELYKEWKSKRKEKPQGKAKFFREFGMHMTREADSKHVYYLLDKSSLKIAERIEYVNGKR